ncbi:MAG TPA: long-chain fatty acid--CoA ligase [Candidatus Marinimicrobia bacterium]|nr:long-chain fatty acid--CoA ligase [Candidatus Neomarinimicrobiota bacterium]HRU92368.1 long-chain fatty acid--CoA ligase [Candidatus Neomarinimicrobiota bacterium]
MNPLVISHRFFENVKKYPDKPALLSKVDGQYRPVLYRDLGEIVKAVALALDSWGFRKGDRVAILSDNREEWIMSDMANQSIGAISVPIYPTLVSSQIGQLFKHSEPRVLFVANGTLLKKAMVTGYQFEHIVIYDPDPELPQAIAFADAQEIGRKLDAKNPEAFPALLNAVEPEDVACINYTSGTTGAPKGALLTHKNFAKDVDNCVGIMKMVPEDRFLSFLPLSHVLERMGGYYTPMFMGNTIGFAESIDTVVQNMAEVQPTILVSVPRLFEKIYATVMSQVESGSAITKKVFFWALKAGKNRMNSYVNKTPLTGWQKRKIKIADKLVFNKLQKTTGGKIQRFVSGGAPLSKEIAEFLFSAGLPVLEGYGLTETSPVVTLNGPDKVRLGSVGVAIPETEFKIAEDSEILVRGPQVMKGYYKDEAATREILDKDGFLHTGDIGHFDEDGFLFITDRKKNILITAGGKNVAPQPIEDAIKLSPYISEAVLFGDRRSYIVALVTLDQNAVKKWAETQHLSFDNYADFIHRPELTTLIANEIERQTAHFSRFEKVKKFRIIPEDFTIESGELTPSLKVKKKVISEKYADLIDEMYRDQSQEKAQDLV